MTYFFWHSPCSRQHPREPAPYQTASILSFITFSYLDPMIWSYIKKKRTGEKVEVEDIPVIADQDRIKTLVERTFPVCIS